MEDLIQWLASIWKDIDPKLILKALISAIGGLWGFMKSRDALRSSRKTLLTDLEVMRLLDKDDPNYRLVSDRINKRIALIYGGEPPSRLRRMFRLERGSKDGYSPLKRLHLSRAFIADICWLVLIIYYDYGQCALWWPKT